MQVPRPSDDDRARFHALVPDDPTVEVKPMFGNLAALVNGNMFAGLFGSDLGLKLSDADQEQLRAAGGGAYGPAERPMRGYTTLPPTLPNDDQEAWVGRALAYVSTLAPKLPKARARSRPRPTD